MKGMKTQSFEFRTTIEPFKRLMLDVFSPPEINAAAIGEFSKFLIDSQMMKMTSPSSLIAAAVKSPKSSNSLYALIYFSTS